MDSEKIQKFLKTTERKMSEGKSRKNLFAMCLPSETYSKHQIALFFFITSALQTFAMICMSSLVQTVHQRECSLKSVILSRLLIIIFFSLLDCPSFHPILPNNERNKNLLY